MEHEARLSQATAMVSSQAQCTPVEALILIGERAQIEHVTVWALALGVIEHTIRFA